MSPSRIVPITLVAATLLAGLHPTLGGPLPAAAALPASSTVAFEPNLGQWAPEVLFVARARDATVTLTTTGFVFAESRALPRLPADADGNVAASEILRGERPAVDAAALRLVGARLAQAAGDSTLPGYTNYFHGSDPQAWATRVPRYARVVAADAWPGIDLVLRGNDAGAFEYDFHVAPLADASLVRLEADGAVPVVRADGALVLRVGEAEFVQAAPVAWSQATAARLPVAAAFAVRGQTVTFQLGPRDARLPLVIDPALTSTTFLGGFDSEYVGSVTALPDGGAIVSGTTFSPEFPVRGGFDSTMASSLDAEAFVARLGSDGALVWSTFLGGSGWDYAAFRGGVSAVGPDGSISIAGRTSSQDFPLVNAFQPQNAGGYCYDTGSPCDGFAARITAGGDALVWSTYFGGEGIEHVMTVGVDATGDTWIAGSTRSPDFPLLGSLLAPDLASLRDWRVSGAAATWGGDVYLLGGDWCDDCNVIYRYDPETNALADTGARLPDDRAGASAVATPDGIYLLGGFTWSGCCPYLRIPTSEILLFHPDTLEVEVADFALPTPSYAASAAFDGTSIWLFGGNEDDGPYWWSRIAKKDEIVRITPATAEVETIATTLPAPAALSAAVASGGSVWIFGGLGDSVIHDSILRFDPATRAIAAVGLLPEPAWGLAAAQADGSILLAGGCSTACGTNDAPRGGADSLRAIRAFDPATQSLTDVGLLPAGRSRMEFASNGDAMFLFGGFENEFFSADVQRVDGDGSAYLSRRGDAFVTRIGPTGSLLYSTLLGGDGSDQILSLLFEEDGDVLLAGSTASRDFPLVGGSLDGPSDILLARLAADGSSLEWARLLGGSGGEVAYSIARAPDGTLRLAGRTSSPDAPVASAAQPTFGGGERDGYLAALGTTGETLLWATYVGAEDEDLAAAVAVDPAGTTWVAGETRSDAFGVLRPLQQARSTRSYATDGFVRAYGPAGALTFSTTVGYNGWVEPSALATAADGGVWILGLFDLATMPSRGETASTEHRDAFVLRIVDGPAPPTEVSDLTATETDLPGHARLTWTAPAWAGESAVSGYRIYRGTSPGLETFLAERSGPSTTFTDAWILSVPPVDFRLGLYYRVTAVSAAGEGIGLEETSCVPIRNLAVEPTC